MRSPEERAAYLAAWREAQAARILAGMEELEDKRDRRSALEPSHIEAIRKGNLQRQRAIHSDTTSPLRKLRLERGLSQKDCAAVAGVHDRTIRKVENGEGGVGQRQLQKIASAFRIPIDDLY